MSFFSVFLHIKKEIIEILTWNGKRLCILCAFNRQSKHSAKKSFWPFVKNNFFAEWLDCLLTRHKMHKMLLLEINISRITLFKCKKTEKKDKSLIISKHDFYKKSFTWNLSEPIIFNIFFKNLTAGIVDYFYVKLVCILWNFIYIYIFNHNFSKVLRKSLEN